VNATTFLRIPVTNDVKYYDASGAANGPARRVVVATTKCNACHGLLTAHGSNRTGTTQVCAVCHNPDATDEGQRAAAQSAASPPPLKPETPIDFKVLVHSIHGDRVKEHPYVVIGFGGSTNTFPIGFPNDPGNCAICHDGTSFQIPLPAVAHDTTVDTGANVADPADNVRIAKTIAVCTACHDRVHFDNTAGLGPCNTTATGECNHTGGPQANDQNCQLCHGAGAQFAVDKVHPVAEPAAVTQ
jgi:OmcA/MtrC family decaheme c-type cytochrome